MKKLINLLFGHKYYLNIINDGECDYICSTIFPTLTAARQHRQSLSETEASNMWDASQFGPAADCSSSTELTDAPLPHCRTVIFSADEQE